MKEPHGHLLLGSLDSPNNFREERLAGLVAALKQPERPVLHLDVSGPRRVVLVRNHNVKEALHLAVVANFLHVRVGRADEPAVLLVAYVNDPLHGDLKVVERGRG